MSDGNQMVMELNEVGAYTRLMCVCWIEGNIPTDIRKLAKLAGTNPREMRSIWPAIAPCFETDPVFAGFLVHPRLERERVKQASFREKARQAGKKSAEKRKERSTPVEGALDSSTNQNPTLQSSSSFSSLLTNPDGTGDVEKFTISGLVEEARQVLGKGQWAENGLECRKARDVIVKEWEGRGVKLKSVYEAIHGLRLLVDAGTVEWLRKDKGRALGGLEVLVNTSAVIPSSDGTRMTSLFDAAGEAYRRGDDGPRKRGTSNPSSISADVLDFTKKLGMSIS